MRFAVARCIGTAHPEMREMTMVFKKFVIAALQLGAVLIFLSAEGPSALAQAKWEKLAPFPEPAEEILGVAAAGKMYVFAGLIPFWKPKGLLSTNTIPATGITGRRKSDGAAVAPRRVHGISRQNLRVRWIRLPHLRSRGVGADQQFLGVRSGRRYLESARADVALKARLALWPPWWGTKFM